MACEAEEKKGREGAVGKRSKGMKGAKMKFVPFSFIIASFLARPESEGEGDVSVRLSMVLMSVVTLQFLRSFG